jgi:predicted Zn finger-like uncharacterized protein
MFTQCYRCETIFRVSAEALRAAGGQVRCGRCGDVFSALARLAEKVSDFKQGESTLELETRADALLRSAQPMTPLETPAHVSGPEIARLEIVDPPDDTTDLETSLEFTLPPGELDRVFIETPSVIQVLSPPPAPASAAPQTSAPSPAAASAPAVEVAAPPSTPLVRTSGLEVSETVQQEMLESYAHAELPPIIVRRRGLPPLVWVVGGILLLLLLIVQLVQINTGWLSPAPRAKVSSYELRQWGVTGDPAAPGTLRVRASIMNTAAQLQPYPLLRVVLSDRFGKRVASREFEPSEYLGKPPSRLLAPGEHADATMEIVDPGKDAESFEIDICVRNGADKPLCAGDAAAAST